MEFESKLMKQLRWIGSSALKAIYPKLNPYG
jgi:hypothetical protein